MKCSVRKFFAEAQGAFKGCKEVLLDSLPFIGYINRHG